MFNSESTQSSQSSQSMKSTNQTLILPSEQQILNWIELGMVFTKKPIAYKNRNITGCPEETISDKFNFPKGSWEIILDKSLIIRDAYNDLLTKYDKMLEKPEKVKYTNFSFETTSGNILTFEKPIKQVNNDSTQENEENEKSDETSMIANLVSNSEDSNDETYKNYQNFQNYQNH